MNQYKCPVCGNRDCVRQPNGADVKCKLCLTVDNARTFAIEDDAPSDPIVEDAPEQHVSAELAEHRTILSPDETMREYFPPENVQRAAQVVHNYFVARGAKQWAFGSMQSRNWTEPEIGAPTMGLPDIKRLAAAFQCDVVQRSAIATVEQVVRNMQGQVKFSREHGDDHDAELLEEPLDALLTVVPLSGPY